MARPSKNRIADPSKFSASVRALNPHLAGKTHCEILVPQEPTTAPLKLTSSPLPKSRYRSRTEAEFSLILEREYQERRIVSWDYEAITLVIGDPPIRYTPDFFKVGNDGSLILLEIKGGFIREAALVRFKAAKKQYPCFQFEMWQKKNRAWTQIL